MKYESIIWDWNGTLLNDVRIAIDSINYLLLDRKLVPLTLERYLEVFTFPVQNYYEQIGFDLKNVVKNQKNVTFANRTLKVEYVRTL